MKSKRQYSTIGSHSSDAEDIEAQLQEEIRKLSKKPRTNPAQQSTSDISILYNPATGKRLQQAKHHRIRQKRNVHVTSIGMKDYNTPVHMSNT